MAEGRVTVDGIETREPGTVVEPDQVEIRFNGRIVRPEIHVYLALHKPPGYVCTARDPQGRPRALDLAPPGAGRLFTVGRLDAESEGLILLTNDGDFAHRLMHPRHEVTKLYHLWLHEPLSREQCTQWKAGIHDQGERLKVLEIRPLEAGRGGFGYRIRLGEGKNRHLRRMAAASGKKVLRLQRVAIGRLALGALKRGQCRPLSSGELHGLGMTRSDRAAIVDSPSKHR